MQRPQRRRRRLRVERLEPRRLLAVDLAVEISGDRSEVVPLVPATYEISVTNKGTDDANDVSIASLVDGILEEANWTRRVSLSLETLDGTNGFTVPGRQEYDLLGIQVDDIGDINADGIDDVAIGASGGDAVYVLFGSDLPQSAVLDLANFNPAQGFIIEGIPPNGDLGRDVSSAGDVNDDGIADLIVVGGDTDAYVIFGSSSGFDFRFDLASLDGTDGFVIDCESVSSSFSRGRVSGAGDINADGIDDVVIGLPYARPHGEPQTGAAVVVFGSSLGFTPNFDVASLDGTNGFVFEGVAARDWLGESVSGLGDINGDGIDDLIIGALAADPDGRDNPGASYVLFGSASGFAASISPQVLDGSNGFAIWGGTRSDELGDSVSGAGDVNGDGIDDLIVSAIDASPIAEYKSTGALVVFGTATGFPATIDMMFTPDSSPLDGTNGFAIVSAERLDGFGSRVSRAGDVNGDGVDDLVVGASTADADDVYDAGAVHILFGSTSGFEAVVEITAPDAADVLTIRGISVFAQSGSSVSGAGDFNDDGYDDLVIGAWRTSLQERVWTGQAFMVFGRTFDFGVGSGTGDLAAAFDLPAGYTVTYTITGITPASAGGQVVLSATALEGSGEDTNPADNTASLAQNVKTRDVDVQVSIDQNTQVLGPGVPFNRIVTVRNEGDFIANGSAIDIGFSGPLENISWTRQVILPETEGELDLTTLDPTRGFVIEGHRAGDRVGTSVRSAGDLNADGIDDLVIGAPYADTAILDDVGEAYIVFGRTENYGDQLRIADLDGNNGFVIRGHLADQRIGRGVASAGDVNNDGVDDLLLSDGNNAAYVVFGSAGGFTPTFEIASLDGSNGLTISGGELASITSISGLGDLNGDGIGDLAIGSDNAAPLDVYRAGVAYVVFGSAGGFPANIDLATLEASSGFFVHGSVMYESLGRSVAGLGDFNADGLNDLAISAPDAQVDGIGKAGKTFILFGSDTGFPLVVDPATLDGSNGLVIEGSEFHRGVGYRMSDAGDVNHDGLADIVMDSYNPYEITSQNLVAYGTAGGFPGTLSAADLDGTHGVVIDAWLGDPYAGQSLGGGGDVNGDGVDDLVIGSLRYPEAYVVYGSRYRTEPIETFSLDGANGFTLFAERGTRSVDIVRDINGDGLDDFVVGVSAADPVAGEDAGKVYVVYGTNTRLVTSGTGEIHESIDLPPGGIVTYTFTATVAVDAVGSVDSTAQVTSSPGHTETNLTNNADSVSEPILVGLQPTVESVVLNDGSPSRSQVTSVTVTFSTQVEHEPLAEALTLTNLDTGDQVGILHIETTDVDSKTVASLTFDGASTVTRQGTGPLGNSLARGNYRMIIEAAKVIRLGTNIILDGDEDGISGGDFFFGDDPSDRLFALYGDDDGDGIVTLLDFVAFRRAFGSSAGDANYSASLDQLGDGAIGLLDFASFRRMFGQAR